MAMSSVAILELNADPFLKEIDKAKGDVEALNNVYKKLASESSAELKKLISTQRELDKAKIDLRGLKRGTDEYRRQKAEVDRLTAAVQRLKANQRQLRLAKQYADGTKAIKQYRREVDKTSASSKNLIRTAVNWIRMTESVLAGWSMVSRAIDQTIGKGYEFNAQMEEMRLGMQYLFANMGEAGGKGMAFTDRFSAAKGMVDDLMPKIIELNNITPQTLKQTTQMFTTLYGSVKSYGFSLEEILTLTKRLGIAGRVAGVETQQILKTIDSALTGQAKESEFTRALTNQFGLSQKAIREALKHGKEYYRQFILESTASAEMVAEQLGDTFTAKMNQIGSKWEQLWGAMMKSSFEQSKELLEGIDDMLAEMVRDSDFWGDRLSNAFFGSMALVATSIGAAAGEKFGISFLAGLSRVNLPATIGYLIYEGLQFAANEARKELESQAASAAAYRDNVDLYRRSGDDIGKDADAVRRLRQEFEQVKATQDQIAANAARTLQRMYQAGASTKQLNQVAEGYNRQLDESVSTADELAAKLYDATDGAEGVAAGADHAASSIDGAANSARILTYELQQAVAALNGAMMGFQVLTGQMSQVTADSRMLAQNFQAAEQEIQRLNTAAMAEKDPAQLEKLSKQMIQLATQQQQWINDVTQKGQAAYAKKLEQQVQLNDLQRQQAIYDAEALSKDEQRLALQGSRIQKLQEEIAVQQQLANSGTLTQRDEARIKLQQLNLELTKANQKYSEMATKATRAGGAGARAAKQSTDEVKKLNEELAKTVSGELGNAFEGFFQGLMDGTTDFGDLMKNTLKQIAMELIRILFIQRMVNALSGGLGGLFGGLSGPGATVSAYAKGGIVSSPTVFTHAGGLGVAGEKGTEAIMPVTRLPNGNLGVEATTNPVTVNVINNSSSEVEVQQNEDNTLDIIINRIATDIARGTGPLPSSLESRYALSKA